MLDLLSVFELPTEVLRQHLCDVQHDESIQARQLAEAIQEELAVRECHDAITELLLEEEEFEQQQPAAGSTSKVVPSYCHDETQQHNIEAAAQSGKPPAHLCQGISCQHQQPHLQQQTTVQNIEAGPKNLQQQQQLVQIQEEHVQPAVSPPPQPQESTQQSCSAGQQPKPTALQAAHLAFLEEQARLKKARHAVARQPKLHGRPVLKQLDSTSNNMPVKQRQPLLQTQRATTSGHDTAVHSAKQVQDQQHAQLQDKQPHHQQQQQGQQVQGPEQHLPQQGGPAIAQFTCFPSTLLTSSSDPPPDKHERQQQVELDQLACAPQQSHVNDGSPTTRVIAVQPAAEGAETAAVAAVEPTQLLQQSYAAQESGLAHNPVNHLNTVSFTSDQSQSTQVKSASGSVDMHQAGYQPADDVGSKVPGPAVVGQVAAAPSDAAMITQSALAQHHPATGQQGNIHLNQRQQQTNSNLLQLDLMPAEIEISLDEHVHSLSVRQQEVQQMQDLKFTAVQQQAQHSRSPQQPQAALRLEHEQQQYQLPCPASQQSVLFGAAAAAAGVPTLEVCQESTLAEGLAAPNRPAAVYAAESVPQVTPHEQAMPEPRQCLQPRGVFNSLTGRAGIHEPLQQDCWRDWDVMAGSLDETGTGFGAWEVVRD